MTTIKVYINIENLETKKHESIGYCMTIDKKLKREYQVPYLLCALNTEIPKIIDDCLRSEVILN